MRRSSDRDNNLNLIEQHRHEQMINKYYQPAANGSKPQQSFTPQSDNSTTHSNTDSQGVRKNIGNYANSANKYFSHQQQQQMLYQQQQQQFQQQQQYQQYQQQHPQIYQQQQQQQRFYESASSEDVSSNGSHSQPATHYHGNKNLGARTGHNIYLNTNPEDSKLQRDPAPMLAPKSKKMSLGSITFTSEQAREFGVFIKDNSFFLRVEKCDSGFNDKLSYQVETLHGIQVPRGLPDTHEYWPENALYNYCQRKLCFMLTFAILI